MNDEINSNVMVDDFYGEPLDVVKYINTDSADEFMCLLIDEAIDFYSINNYSPIVEQQKFDGFVVDYYFVADCVSKFIEARVMKVVNDEKFVKNMRIKIKSDFSESGDCFLKNGAWLLATLDFLDIVVFQKKRKGIFSKTIYSTTNKYGEKIVFVLSGVFLHNQKAVAYERNMKKIGTKNNYKMEAFGRAMTSVLLRFNKEDQKVLQF